MDIDFGYLNAAKVVTQSYDNLRLALVGCGGTGSWAAAAVIRVARLLREKFSKRVDVTFIDPDVVEAKNVYRQNFCDAEIGRSKAITLAWRYGLSWGVEVMGIHDKFSGDMIKGGDLVVLVGCVDGAEGRRAMAEAAMENNQVWWIDCGNHRAAGQVVIGRGGRKSNAPALPGCCSWLPLPTVLHPELLEDEVSDEKDKVSSLSCADMAMQDSQGLAINQRVAAEASDYLVRLLLTRDLRKQATYIDLASGSARSLYVAGDV